MMNIIPQSIIDKMDPTDRASLPLPKKAKLTTSERRSLSETALERDMHNEFINYLRLRNRVFAYVHADPTRRSTIQKGHPDFTVFCKSIDPAGKPKTYACLLEFKVPGGRLSEAQINRCGELSKAGIDVYVVTSTK